MAAQKQRPFVVAMIGPVGSGKTYIAKILAKRLRAQRFTTDDIRRRLARQGQSISRAIAISDKLREQALSRQRSIILDFDAVRAQKHRELKALAKRHGGRIYFVRVKAPEAVILKRLRSQRYPIPGVFNSLKYALLAYFSRRRFHRRPLRARPLFVIDNSGAQPLGPQIDRIVRNIGSPPVARR